MCRQQTSFGEVALIPLYVQAVGKAQNIRSYQSVLLSAVRTWREDDFHLSVDVGRAKGQVRKLYTDEVTISEILKSGFLKREDEFAKM